MEKKPVEDAEYCSECEHLQNDNGVSRCEMYYGAKIEDTNEKHCKESIF